jgi:hypothetical protein
MNHRPRCTTAFLAPFLHLLAPSLLPDAEAASFQSPITNIVNALIVIVLVDTIVVDSVERTRSKRIISTSPPLLV